MSRRKKKKKNIFLKILIILLIIISIAAGIIYGICKAKYNGDFKKMFQGFANVVFGEVEKVNILLIGISEDIGTELTDTIIVCSYDPQTQNAYMLSIPRDTFVGENINKANASSKINSRYQNGIEVLEEDVEELTGINIDYYAIVRTTMLPDIVDKIGGVEFDVPIDMNYDDKSQNLHIHLKKGVQQIDGDKAEQLLRFRHNNNGTSYPYSYGDNDLGRMKTQREFIKATAGKILSWKNTLKINSLIDNLFDNLETNMPKSTILSYVPFALDLDIDTVKMEQMPGTPKQVNGVWLFVNDEKQTKELVEDLETSESENVAETIKGAN